MVNPAETEARIEDLEARLEAKKADLRDLATMGAVITSILEIDSVLSVVMDMSIRLVDGEVGLIMLDEGGELKPKISWGVQEDFVKSLTYRNDGPLAIHCFNTQESVILNELDVKGDAGILINSIICLPVKSGDRCHGILMIINKSSGDNFAAEDQEMLETLLNFVAVAIDNSILIQDKLAKQRMEQEMSIAKQIQETILPQNIDDIEGSEIGAVYYPAREVGGDFYDVHSIDRTKFLVFIGDVSNKGVPAALVMSAASGIIKSILAADPNIEVDRLAGGLNDILVKHIIRDREMFVTMFICKFDLDSRQLTYCNAGHLPGLFWDDEARAVCELAEGGNIIGQFPAMLFQRGQRRLGRNDRLFLFTDGLTEATDADRNLFGRERAEQVFSVEIGLPPKEFCATVKEWVDRFTAGTTAENQDDFTILQVKVL